MPLTIALTKRQYAALQVLRQAGRWMGAYELGVSVRVLLRLEQHGYVDTRDDGSAWLYRITDAGRKRLELQR